jgi:hypothetical protein
MDHNDTERWNFMQRCLAEALAEYDKKYDKKRAATGLAATPAAIEDTTGTLDTTQSTIADSVVDKEVGGGTDGEIVADDFEEFFPESPLPSSPARPAAGSLPTGTGTLHDQAQVTTATLESSSVPAADFVMTGSILEPGSVCAPGSFEERLEHTLVRNPDLGSMRPDAPRAPYDVIPKSSLEDLRLLDISNLEGLDVMQADIETGGRDRQSTHEEPLTAGGHWDWGANAFEPIEYNELQAGGFKSAPLPPTPQQERAAPTFPVLDVRERAAPTSPVQELRLHDGSPPTTPTGTLLKPLPRASPTIHPSPTIYHKDDRVRTDQEVHAVSSPGQSKRCKKDLATLKSVLGAEGKRKADAISAQAADTALMPPPAATPATPATPAPTAAGAISARAVTPAAVADTTLMPPPAATPATPATPAPTMAGAISARAVTPAPVADTTLMPPPAATPATPASNPPTSPRTRKRRRVNDEVYGILRSLKETTKELVTTQDERTLDNWDVNDYDSLVEESRDKTFSIISKADQGFCNSTCRGNPIKLNGEKPDNLTLSLLKAFAFGLSITADDTKHFDFSHDWKVEGCALREIVQTHFGNPIAGIIHFAEQVHDLPLKKFGNHDICCLIYHAVKLLKKHAEQHGNGRDFFFELTGQPDQVYNFVKAWLDGDDAQELRAMIMGLEDVSIVIRVLGVAIDLDRLRSRLLNIRATMQSYYDSILGALEYFFDTSKEDFPYSPQLMAFGLRYAPPHYVAMQGITHMLGRKAGRRVGYSSISIMSKKQMNNSYTNDRSRHQRMIQDNLAHACKRLASENGLPTPRPSQLTFVSMENIKTEHQFFRRHRKSQGSPRSAS